MNSGLTQILGWRYWNTVASHFTGHSTVCSKLYSNKQLFVQTLLKQTTTNHQSSTLSTPFLIGIQCWLMLSPYPRASNSEIVSMWWHHHGNFAIFDSRDKPILIHIQFRPFQEYLVSFVTYENRSRVLRGSIDSSYETNVIGYHGGKTATEFSNVSHSTHISIEFRHKAADLLQTSCKRRLAPAHYGVFFVSLMCSASVEAVSDTISDYIGPCYVETSLYSGCFRYTCERKFIEHCGCGCIKSEYFHIFKG